MSKYQFQFASTGSGQTSTFQLPADVFKLPAPASNVPLIHNGQQIGTYSIAANGEVTLNFNAGLNNVDAMFEFTTWINPGYGFESNKQTIELASGHTVMLQALFTDQDSKKGVLTKSPDKITWTIDVNTELKTVLGARCSSN